MLRNINLYCEAVCLTLSPWHWHNMKFYSIFLWGAHIKLLKSNILKELYFFTMSLSQKFKVCTFLCLISKQFQLLTKFQILRWGAHLLIKTILEHKILLLYAKWFPRKFTRNFGRGRLHECHKMWPPPSSLQTAITRIHVRPPLLTLHHSATQPRGRAGQPLLNSRHIHYHDTSNHRQSSWSSRCVFFCPFF